jgi:hypothetical protein
MKTVKIVLFVLGIFLLVLNVSGLFMSLRNDQLYSEKTPYRDDISVPFPEAKKLWTRKDGESDKDFAIRATWLFNHSMAHYWRDEGIKKYNMLVPWWENYIIRLQQVFTGDKKYEFRNYKKVMERGVGICSQPCIGLQDLLRKNGIGADLWDIKGHVVVEATFDTGEKIILDPDYGHIVPYSMAEIEKDPEIVRASYINQDDVYDPELKEHKHTQDLIDEYMKDGNHIYTMDKTFEDFAYAAKWILPFLLILPFFFTFITTRKS